MDLPSAASSASTTVHAPQSPSAQPSLVPVRPATSRRYSSTVVVAGRSATSTISPSSTKRTAWESVPAIGACVRPVLMPSAAAIRGVAPRRDDQWHMIILRRIGDAETHHHVVDERRLGELHSSRAKIL